MSTTTFAYAAGIIDGEGTIGIWRETRAKNARGYRYRVALEISNTKEELIDWFVEQFGGFKSSSQPKNKNAQLLFKWRCTTSEVPVVLDKLEPYLKIKQEQLQLAKRFVEVQERYNQRPGKRQDGRALEEYEQLWLAGKALNKRGV